MADHEEFIAKFQTDKYTAKYVTHDGRDAWRTFASYHWFRWQCDQYGFIRSTSYEAEKDGWTLSYCEGDVMLSRREPA